MMINSRSIRKAFWRAALLLVHVCCLTAGARETPEALDEVVQATAARVKPALVRIHVVETEYYEGRELKYESFGSGVVVSPDGHVITNHHVAGRAVRLTCTFADREEIPAELVGADPLTDIAVIKLTPKGKRTFPVATFGDSSQVRVGEYVLALGSPMALTQSVTLGIVSNTEMTMPRWYGTWGRVTQEGEDVGALVRWIGHDAEIHGGNSGGPLVNLQGEIVGINEIKMGLAGAIPGNLARDVARKLITRGDVARAWLGIDVQPRLKHDDHTTGILVCGALEDSPAQDAGFEPGDLLIELAGQEVNVRFEEELPPFNAMVADLPIGEPVEAVVIRGGERAGLTVTPVAREKLYPDQVELKQWGITARDLSLVLAKELKRKTAEGVLVTSVRPGGPAGDAKPELRPKDVIVALDNKPISNLGDLRALTKLATEDKTEPTPALAAFERGGAHHIAFIELGIEELPDPALEVKKAWLPAETQVVTRPLARQLGREELRGFRVTRVYPGMTAAEAGLKVGDTITAVDGEPLRARAPEDYEELPALIREYRIGDTAEFSVLRDDEEITLAIELMSQPKNRREMEKYRDERFEFTVRDMNFLDKAREELDKDQTGVLVEEVKTGGWAALGMLSVGDIVVAINGESVETVADFEPIMEEIADDQPDWVVFRVLRGIHYLFLELEPKWDDNE